MSDYKYSAELESLGIVLPAGGKGKTKCPQCNSRGKHLKVDTEEGVYYCHRCSWQGSVKSRPAEKDARTDRLHAYFHGRGISEEIYRKMGIRQQGRNIYMPYLQDGVEVNKKERPFDQKRFFQKKGGANVLYNYDGIKDKKIIYIVEGEMDVLSFMQAGIYSVCSPNQGAPSSKDSNAAKKLESIHDAYDILREAEQLILGADNDSNGQAMNEYIIKLFGRDKCRVIDWQDSKDANEVLTKHGPEKLRKLIGSASFSYTADERRLLEYSKANEMHHDKVLPLKDEIITIQDSRIASNGNITTIAGQSKSGKSSVASAIIAGVINDSDDVDTIGMNIAHNGKGKAVLYYDTEQDPSDLYYGNFMTGMLRRAQVKQEPDWLHVISLRSLSMDDRRKLIELDMERYKREHDGLHMVVLDGGSDFIESIIDDREAAEFVRFLMKCAEEYDTSIIVLLHFNPSDGGMPKARGHLGGELERKSEAVLSITSDPDNPVKTMKPYRKLIRKGTPFDPIQFSWNHDKNMMTLTNGPSLEYSEPDMTECPEYLVKIFAENGNKGIRYTDLCTEIKNAQGVKTTAAQNRVAKFSKRNVLIEENRMYRLREDYLAKDQGSDPDKVPF
jgi:hypothetical protein